MLSDGQMKANQKIKDLHSNAMFYQRLVCEFAHKEGIHSDEYKRAEKDLWEAEHRLDTLLEFVTIEDGK